MTEQQ